MSGLIEHYTRRRRAQADKKAEQPRSDSWDPAETDAARRAPDDGATAWTNGHVTNVQPINRGDRRRRGWRDGVDQEAVSGNGTGSGHDGGDPDGRAGRGGSPNLFDYAAAEEHSAVAEPVPAERNAPAEDYVDTVDYGPAENYAPATEAYAPPTEAYAPPTEEYTAPDLEHEPPAEEPPTPHAAAPDATALQHDASHELAQPEDLVDEDVANWVDATVEGPGYDEPPTVEFRALPTEEPQVDAEARVTAEPVPVDPEPTASVDPEPTATSEPETAAGPGAAAAEPAATDEPAAAPEPRTARAISWRPRRARPLKQAAAVTTPEPPPAAEAATEAAPSPEEPRSRVIHWRANAARQTSAAVPEAPPETPPEETAEIAPAPPPETTDTPFAQIPPADPPPAPHAPPPPPPPP
ncbi:MAG: hypothetical protein QOJ25_1706, partial [Solirubrobacteraceae bacterium]|nr:hypothetical protein [Solirubrobacteraceae bacterium]